MRSLDDEAVAASGGAETVFASPGVAPVETPAMDLALAPGAMAAGTAVQRAIEQARGERTVRPEPSPQMARLEQPLFAPPSVLTAGVAETMQRAFSTPGSGGGQSAVMRAPGSSGGGFAQDGSGDSPVEAFGAVTSVQREVTGSGSQPSTLTEGTEETDRTFSQSEIEDLSERVWQFVRRQLKLERERQRGRT